MIEIDTVTALMLYLFFFLLLCIGAWLLFHLKTRNKQLLPPLYELKQCEYCAYCYLATTAKTITTCPQCNSYNKNK